MVQKITPRSVPLCNYEPPSELEHQDHLHSTPWLPVVLLIKSNSSDRSQKLPLFSIINSNPRLPKSRRRAVARKEGGGGWPAHHQLTRYTTLYRPPPSARPIDQCEPMGLHTRDQRIVAVAALVSRAASSSWRVGRLPAAADYDHHSALDDRFLCGCCRRRCFYWTRSLGEWVVGLV